MKHDLSDIGFALMLCCFGIGALIKDIGEKDMRVACVNRGGYLQKVEDKWFAEKRCVVPAAKEAA